MNRPAPLAACHVAGRNRRLSVGVSVLLLLLLVVPPSVLARTAISPVYDANSPFILIGNACTNPNNPTNEIGFRGMPFTPGEYDTPILCSNVKIRGDDTVAPLCLTLVDPSTGRHLLTGHTDYHLQVKVERVCPIQCGLILPAAPSEVKCAAAHGLRRLLACTAKDVGATDPLAAADANPLVAKWIDTGSCDAPAPELICRDPRLKGERAYRAEIYRIVRLLSGAEHFADPYSSRSRAAERIIRARVCPNKVDPTSPGQNRLLDAYVLQVLAFELQLHWRPKYQKENVCDWPAVECSGMNYVTALRLGDMHLRGTLPAEITLLRDLVCLALDHNALKGTIPHAIGDLEGLQELDLDDNQLTGTLPPSMYKLKQLVWLDLDSNMLRGTISVDIADLQALTTISLFNNKFSGQVPEAFGQLDLLEALFLDGNNFAGFCGQRLCRNRQFNLEDLSVDCDFVDCAECNPTCYY